VTQENAPVNRSERDAGSRGNPESADEVAILDYVMLDFADEHFAPRNRQGLCEPDPAATEALTTPYASGVRFGSGISVRRRAGVGRDDSSFS
jgi:hypothetical protein